MFLEQHSSKSLHTFFAYPLSTVFEKNDPLGINYDTIIIFKFCTWILDAAVTH